jgi:hypothetical protein
MIDNVLEQSRLLFLHEISSIGHRADTLIHSIPIKAIEGVGGLILPFQGAEPSTSINANFFSDLQAQRNDGKGRTTRNSGDF